jgi:hypothetical protein
MCNIDAIQTNSRALVQDAAYTFQQVGSKAIEGATTLLQYSWTVISATTDMAERVFRSPEPLNYSLQGIANAINTLAPSYSITIPQKLMDNLDIAQNFVSATRFVQSVKYFLLGKYMNDITAGKYGSLVGEACLMIGRGGITTSFLVDHNLVDISPIVQSIGQIPVFGSFALQALNYPLTDGFIMAGLIAFSFERVNAILNGENLVYNVVSLMNLITETALIRLSLSSSLVNPLVIAGLSAVVVTCGIASFLLEPKAAPVASNPTAASGAPARVAV